MLSPTRPPPPSSGTWHCPEPHLALASQRRPHRDRYLTGLRVTSRPTHIALPQTAPPNFSPRESSRKDTRPLLSRLAPTSQVPGLNCRPHRGASPDQRSTRHSTFSPLNSPKFLPVRFWGVRGFLYLQTAGPRGRAPRCGLTGSSPQGPRRAHAQQILGGNTHTAAKSFRRAVRGRAQASLLVTATLTTQRRTEVGVHGTWPRLGPGRHVHARRRRERAQGVGLAQAGAPGRRPPSLAGAAPSSLVRAEAAPSAALPTRTTTYMAHFYSLL